MEANGSQNSSNLLFPAYADKIPSCSTSIFPAYTAQKSEVVAPKNKEWLCNSSYSPSNFYESIQSKDDQSSENDLEIGEPIKKKKKHHKKFKKKKESKKYQVPDLKSYAVSESDSIRHQLNKKIFIEETGLSFERAFRMDSEGDFENAYYDSLEQKKIAKYKLYPKIPVGCSVEERSLWNPKPETDPKNTSVRYFSKRALKSLSKSLSKELDFSLTKGETLNIVLDFIPLFSRAKTFGPMKNSSKPEFEGISMSWQSTSESRSDSKTIAKEEKKDEETDSELRSKIIAYNKKLAESPCDIQLWLEFVHFQDELLNSVEAAKSDLALTEASLMDKKLAILDKALKHNPKSVQLHIEKLTLCRNLWKIDKVIACWDELIFMNPNNPDIWKEYITFILTNLTYFSTPRVLQVFAKCLRTLSNLNEGFILSHAPPEDLVINMIDIFTQLCFILQSCGYSEKAVAAYQALIEFNLYSPNANDTLAVAEKVVCFEPFWDSGAPRFGEEGAIGWAATVEQKRMGFAKIVTESDLCGIEDDILCKKYPMWKTWLEFERMREMHQWLPWKPNPEYDQTDDDIDDMDRCVLFDDISKYLFHVKEEKYKFLLLQHFLHFLGVNPHLFGCNSPVPTHESSRLTIQNYDIISSKLGETLFGEKQPNPLNFEINVWNPDRVHFVKNIFLQSIERFSHEYRILLSMQRLKFLRNLALTSNIIEEKMENVKKFAKNILKEAINRNCLLLWYEYINIELSSNCQIKAKKTAETLLTSSTSAVASGAIDRKEVWYFVKSCIEFSLNFQGNYKAQDKMFTRNEIMWLLLHIGCNENYLPYSDEQILPTRILKAVYGFKNILNDEMRSLDSLQCDLCYCLDPCSYSLIDCIKCFIYFMYFAQGLDVSIEELSNYTESLKQKLPESRKRYVLQLLSEFRAELLNFHVHNSTVSMQPLLFCVYSAIEQFPNSTKLLHILIQIRHASAVINPTRRFFSKILKESCKTNPITWFFAIASELAVSQSIMKKDQDPELQYYESMPSNTGIKWKIRSLYEKALESSNCGYIPVLWRSYLKFEVLNNENDRAKSIFHRALQNCGWSKELIMQGLETFPDDLKEIIDFMTEKQIRIHSPLEEITLLMEHCFQE